MTRRSPEFAAPAGGGARDPAGGRGARMSTAERLPAAGPGVRPGASGRAWIPAPSAARCCCRSRGSLAWQLVVWIAAPREWLLPSPAAVAEVLWTDRERLWFHAQATIAEAAVGFALAAVVGLALAMAIAGLPRGGAARSTPGWSPARRFRSSPSRRSIAIWLDYGTAQVMVAFVDRLLPGRRHRRRRAARRRPGPRRGPSRTLGAGPRLDLSERHAPCGAAGAVLGPAHGGGLRGHGRRRRRVRRAPTGASATCPSSRPPSSAPPAASPRSSCSRSSASASSAR